MSMSMIKWVVTTSDVYRGLQDKDINALYFLKDTQEIYKGTQSFTQSSELVPNFPPKGAQGRIYIHENTLEGRVWVNDNWKTVIHPIAESLTEGVRETKAVSGEAVKTYVKEHVSAAIADNVNNITFDKISKQLTYETVDGSSNTVDIDGFLTGAKYNPKTGMLSFDVQGGRGIHINLPKDNFVESGRYDADRKLIVLDLVSGDSVEIPAGDLIDDTEFVSTETIDMTVSDAGEVSANVKLAGGDNKIQIKNGGLYVAPTDLSTKLDKVERDRTNEIIIAQEDGSVAVSGFKTGGELLSETPSQNTLATESAVAAIRTILSGEISTKVSKSDITQEIREEALASEEKVASEKAVAIAIDALKEEKINKTDITKKLDHTSVSDDKVVSEKAVVAALSWVELR